MNLVIFDSELLFDETQKFALSHAAEELLALRNFEKAVVLVGASDVTLRRMRTLSARKVFRFSVMTELNSLEHHFKKTFRDVADENILDIFFVAHVNAPGIYLGNQTGFKTIGILRDHLADQVSLFPDSQPVYTRYCIGDIPELVRSPTQSMFSFA